MKNIGNNKVTVNPFQNAWINDLKHMKPLEIMETKRKLMKMNKKQYRQEIIAYLSEHNIPYEKGFDLCLGDYITIAFDGCANAPDYTIEANLLFNEKDVVEYYVYYSRLAQEIVSKGSKNEIDRLNQIIVSLNKIVGVNLYITDQNDITLSDAISDQTSVERLFEILWEDKEFLNSISPFIFLAFQNISLEEILASLHKHFEDYRLNHHAAFN